MESCDQGLYFCFLRQRALSNIWRHYDQKVKISLIISPLHQQELLNSASIFAFKKNFYEEGGKASVCSLPGKRNLVLTFWLLFWAYKSKWYAVIHKKKEITVVWLLNWSRRLPHIVII